LGVLTRFPFQSFARASQKDFHSNPERGIVLQLKLFFGRHCDQAPAYGGEAICVFLKLFFRHQPRED